MNALNVVSHNPFTRAGQPAKTTAQKPLFQGIPQSSTVDEVYFGGPGRIGQIDEFYYINDFIILPF